MNQAELLEEITRLVIKEVHALKDKEDMQGYIPLSVSARHIHLEQAHVDRLFGQGYQLTHFKDISQPGQYACEEKLTIKGPRDSIENVRVLGPLRNRTQIEVAASDGRALGIKPPVRSSGDLNGAAAITLIGPKGTIHLNEACIVADRHIHMHPDDAKQFKVVDKQKVSVCVEGPRGGVMGEVTIRMNERYVLDMHIDTDDANAFSLNETKSVKLLCHDQRTNVSSA